MIEVSLCELRSSFGLGVAGNFAGHLEQAGEAADFAAVDAVAPEAPKGIFPWYVPGADGFLGRFPLARNRIAKPPSSSDLDLQIEPEAALLCDATYDVKGTIAALSPRAVGAFNDCSIRMPGAKKISEKKNWGADSKGVAPEFFVANDLAADGPTSSLRLMSFLRRNTETHAYGVDSPLSGYSYYGRQLLDWLVERLVNQVGSDDTPLEPVGQYLRDAGNPSSVLIGIGATRYTAFGETTFLEDGDQSIVIVYDADHHSADSIAETVADQREHLLKRASVLSQSVYESVL
ncbi:MAG: DUF5718 family protein [Solirubrobacterales bacterium]